MARLYDKLLINDDEGLVEVNLVEFLDLNFPHSYDIMNELRAKSPSVARVVDEAVVLTSEKHFSCVRDESHLLSAKEHLSKFHLSNLETDNAIKLANSLCLLCLKRKLNPIDIAVLIQCENELLDLLCSKWVQMQLDSAASKLQPAFCPQLTHSNTICLELMNMDDRLVVWNQMLLLTCHTRTHVLDHIMVSVVLHCFVIQLLPYFCIV